MQQHGVSDKWDDSCPSVGDCEDYALCKLKKLNTGRLTLCDTASGAHAILEYNGWFLDNRSNNVTRRPQCSNLKYISPAILQEVIASKQKTPAI